MNIRYLTTTIFGFLLMLSSLLYCADSLDTRSRNMSAPPEIRAMFPQNWVDLVGNPCPTRMADYKKDLVSGTIAPHRVTWDRKTVFTGMSESALIKILGDTAVESEPPTKRTTAESDQYISDLMQANATTMHYYILYSLAGMEGWFKAMKWDLPWGTLKAFLRAPKEKGVYSIYLIHTTLKGFSADTVKLRNVGPNLVASASSPVAVQWNTSNNTLTIGGE